MKNAKDIRVKMVKMNGDAGPFVEVAYMDRNAQEQVGLLLLDTGSCMNILRPEMVEEISTQCFIEGETTNIVSITQDTIDVRRIKFSFVLGCEQFQDVFCVSDFPVEVKGYKVLGILGNIFMQKHRLVIDYTDYSLHTSNATHENLKMSDCSFFFPMDIGLELYGTPVLPIKQSEGDIVCLIDTGATQNMISENTLKDCEFKYKMLGIKDIIRGITGEMEVDYALVNFTYLSLDNEKIYEFNRSEHFCVTQNDIHTLPEGTLDPNGDELPPVKALLGAPFIAKEGWVLDFGAHIMYKHKAA